MSASLLPFLAAEPPSAGGAELGQILIVTLSATVLTSALLVLGLGHRSGRVALLGRIGGFAERALRLPAWAALPLVVAVPTLLLALFGLTWDESLHIDDGRDEGPLANPSHYFLLIGLFGIFSAGWLSLVLPERGERPGPSSVRLARDWHVPVGGLLTMVCGSVALTGFPLDDVSHRLFGQDVSLWGTTHLQMLTGAATGVVALAMLYREGVLAARARVGTDREIPPLVPVPRIVDALVDKLHYATLGGGMLGALSIFMGEYDFGVPQYRLVFHPILIAAIAAFGLVTVRALAGPGAAVLAALWFMAVRGVITLLVGPVFGEAVATFPLFLAEALLVEAAALAVVARRRPIAFGALSGALVGTVGVLAEYGWSKVWMPLAWPGHMLPTAIAYALPVGVACGVMGAFVYGGLDRRAALVRSRSVLGGVALSALVVFAVFAGLRTTSAPDVRAAVTVEEVSPAPERQVVATVRLDPPDAAQDADWFHTLAYQGKEPLRVDDLTEIAPGVYRTTVLPVHGTWKSALRLQRGGEMAAMPIFLPADSAIPVGEVPVPASFERALISDQQILQRERKDDVSDAVVAAFSLLILAISLGIVGLVGRGLVHLAGPVREPGAPRTNGRSRERRRVAAGV